MPESLREEMLFHLHIPKTGGTTLFAALASRIPAERVVQIVPEDTPSPGLAGNVSAALLGGHLTWGAVEALPHPPAVLTVLRDPVDRVFSLFAYLRRHSKARVLDSGSQEAAEHAVMQSLNDIVLGPFTGLRSVIGPVQVDYLSSESFLYRAPERDQTEREVARRLEIALRNLETCAWIGTTETLDRDLQTLAFHLGWPPFGTPERLMVNGPHPEVAELSTRARRELERLVAADRELHARARALADERHRLMIEQMQAERANGSDVDLSG